MLRQIPNAICLARLALVVPIAWTLIHDDPAATLWLFGAAAVSDGADGFLAKRFGWQSDLGAFLDPLADKVLLVTVFVTLAWLDLVPMWLVLLAVGRDLVIVSGALAYRVVVGPVKIDPKISSKINTASQLGFVLIVICRQAFSLPPLWVATAAGAAMMVMTVVSGLDYV
ncbi:MAG: CDP-alcohol phosphatidyltransferase family protein, partial [Proteobacteria bacterium]|nr:CDP-alcohol phosphatidyltransferase family protein [Pseudomonadota bacterium]